MRRTRWIAFVGIATASAVSVSWYFFSNPSDTKPVGRLSHSKKSEERAAPDESDSAERGIASEPVITSVSTYLQTAHECAAVEIPGRGPAQALVSKAEWDEFMKLFRGIKEQYAAWLGARVTRKNSKSMGWMIEQMGALKVQRPPTVGEPDLAWRGVAILSNEPSGEPIIRVGDGFLVYLKQSPARAKFELARAMAQVWAPCTLSHEKKSMDWKLAGITELKQDDCEAPGVSDSAWATSSAMAVQIADPGCSIPGLGSPKAESAHAEAAAEEGGV